ncbi:MAG: hypothetical protein EOP87_12990 [Verrucomicrobiaceae bacterium]|nr:MAG: hypothetical protein EOP87_12990 [Verrucomicrobiaceae bacterium]
MTTNFQIAGDFFKAPGLDRAGAAGQTRNVTVFESNTALIWGDLDVPLLGLTKDWHGVPLEDPAGFSLAMDGRRLWFIATHRKPASLHPQSRPGKFMPGLWEHDVAELFLATPSGDRYFEFNLSPNAAWWSCEFKGPRIREEEADIIMPEVAAFSELAPDGGWVAALSIPLDLLRARIDFGPQSLGNVTFILGNPEPSYLSAADLGSGEPDFHRPSHFRKLRFAPVPPR